MPKSTSSAMPNPPALALDARGVAPAHSLLLLRHVASLPCLSAVSPHHGISAVVSLIHFSSTARKSFDGIISAAGSTLDYYDDHRRSPRDQGAPPAAARCVGKACCRGAANVMDGDDEEVWLRLRLYARVEQAWARVEQARRRPALARDDAVSLQLCFNRGRLHAFAERKKNESLKKRLKRLLTGKVAETASGPRGRVRSPRHALCSSRRTARHSAGAGISSSISAPSTRSVGSIPRVRPTQTRATRSSCGRARWWTAARKPR